VLVICPTTFSAVLGGGGRMTTGRLWEGGEGGVRGVLEDAEYLGGKYFAVIRILELRRDVGIKLI